LLQGEQNQVSSENMDVKTEGQIVLGNWAWSLLRKEQNADC